MKFIWQLLKKQLTATEENYPDTPIYDPALEKFKAAFFLNPALEKLAQETTNSVPAAVETLFYFFNNQYDKLQHINAPSQLLATALERNLTVLNKPKRIHVTALPTEIFDNLAGDLPLLVSECKSKDFAVNLVEMALTGPLSLSSPFSANRAYCQESYEVAPDLNCLRFTDGNHSFFLMQLLSSADAIYFPTDNILLSFAHIDESHAKRLQEKLVKDFAKIISYATSTNSFAGIIASHSRPSHFYYDVWPVLFELANKPALIEKLDTVIMRRNHDFNDPGLLFDYRNSQALDPEEIDSIAVNENKWFVHAGRQQHLSDPFCYEVADQYLVDTALQSPSDIALEKAANISECFPVIWIGVEGQKRCWLEQVEGYAYILNRLARQYPRLGVIFDGWTMPYTPSAASINEAEKDRQVAQAIQQLLDVNIKYVSVIGETSNTKLVVGNVADFFISSFSTGSLHISRLLSKPGFCHLSKRFSEIALRYALHIHPNRQVYLLPNGHVSDKESKDEIRHDHLSYSIDKTVFYRFINERLAAVLDNNAINSPIRFFIEPSYSVSYDLRIYLKMATHGNILHVGSGEDKILNLQQYPQSYLQRHIIYGTFPFGCDGKASMHADYMVWLRHPIPRACYNAIQFVALAANNGQAVSISDVFKKGHKVLDNYFIRILTGDFATPFGKCTESMLDAAINNLESRFIYIGIDEKPAESYDSLCALMDWDRTLFADFPPVRYEFNEGEFSTDELNLAKAMNGLDLRFYDAAVEIFNRRLGQQQSQKLRCA